MIEDKGSAESENASPGRGLALMRILLIEDNPADARLIKEMLRESGGGAVTLECEEMLATGLNRLENEPFDMLILDLNLHDSRGMETFWKVQPFTRLIPVLILTGIEDEELGELAVQGGAQDYLVKGKIGAGTLARSVRYALGRHSSEEALHQSEELYRIIAENITDTVWLTDMNMKYTWISPSVTRLRGFTLEELNIIPFEKNFTPESASVVLKAMVENLTVEDLADKNKKLSVNLELKFYKKDGSTFWGDVELKLLRDAEGKPSGFLGVGRDITDRKHVEQRLHLLNDIAVRLIKVEPEGYGGELERALEDIAALAGADRCFLHLSDYETGDVQQAYEWHREGLEPRAAALVGLDIRPMQWLVTMLEEGRTVKFSSLEELGRKAEIEKASWGAAGIRSLLGVSLFRGERLTGFLGLTSELAERGWNDDDEQLLRQAGHVLSHAIARSEVEEALRESEARLSTLFATMAEGVVFIEPAGAITYANQAAEELLGLKRKTIEERHYTSAEWEILRGDGTSMPKEEMAGARAMMEQRRVTGQVMGVRRPDGPISWISVSASPVIDESGALAGVVGTFADITERKEAEEALVKSEAMIKNVFDTSPLALVLFDRESRLVSMNKAALTMFGVSDLGSAKGYKLFEDPAIEDRWKDSLRNGESVRYEREINTEERLKELGVREPGKKGTICLRVLMSPLSSEEGLSPAGYMIQGQDITDQKRAEAEISKLSRRIMDEYEEARRRIAMDLHDEFGQSITALKIEVEMLGKEAGDRLEDQTERLEGMAAILEDALEKIRSIAAELRPVLLDDFGLEKALGLYVREFSEKTGIPASTDCAGVPAHLGKDIELALFRIAQEAVVNIARHAGATDIRVSLLCEDGLIILTVTDNGRGFDINKMLRGHSIHSPFGILGMRERAVMVGGELNVSSKISEGTTVVVRVPLESQVE